MRSPDVFRGDLVKVEGGIAQVFNTTEGYEFEVRSGAIRTRAVYQEYKTQPYLVRVSEDEVEENVLTNANLRENNKHVIFRSSSEKPSFRPRRMVIYGTLKGTEEIQLQDRSYAEFPVIDAHLVTDPKPNQIEFTASTEYNVTEICVNNECKSNTTNMTVLVDNQAFVNVSMEDDYYADWNNSMWVENIYSQEFEKEIPLTLRS